MILLLALSIVLAQAEEPKPDPTRVDPQMREALEAMRARQSAAPGRTADTPLQLKGRILAGSRPMAILAEGDTFHTVGIGDTVMLRRGRAEVTGISSRGVTIRIGGQSEVLLP